MAALAVTLPCFNLHHHQPNLLRRSSNQTLHFSPPKPLLISSHGRSKRFKALPETITVKLEEEEKQEDTIADLNPPATIINTKLYFGNLPYNVDSATLAQIIQDFANPELVEVLYNRDTGQSRRRKLSKSKSKNSIQWRSWGFSLICKLKLSPVSKGRTKFEIS